MTRSTLAAGSLLVCLLLTLSALAGLAAENHEQAPSELTETEPMHIGGTDPTSFVAPDTSGSVGDYTSIAIDSNDAVHISYYDDTNYDLKYATNTSGYWTTVSVDTSGSVGRYTSIAIDSNDAVHISYLDSTNSDLKYATCSSGCTTASNWGDASVDTSGSVGSYTSIAIDSNDAVHISYTDFTNYDLKLAYDKDTDFDQVLDKNDACPYNYGTSTEDRIGCIDTDGDGWSDLGDDFHNKATQWKDSDGDGLGDNWANENWNNTRESHWPGEWVANAYLSDASPFDFDNDAYEDEDIDDAEEGDGWDACPTLYGTSSEDRGGCIDNDGDGYSNPTSDWDEDDGADEFPGASTQWEDADDDGYGDNAQGNYPDACTSTYGTSYIDVYGCVDNDNDGYSNLSDVDDDDPSETTDTDGDGYGDEGDQFPYDSTQWEDNDDDGYGDNTTGNDPDMFPNDGNEWGDSDGDGYGDNEADQFPYDSSQWNDTDDDGYGDNLSGNNPDMFPFNDEEWGDSDGDGYGDNEADSFPYDSTQYEDNDNDGYGDNTSGNNPDIFPDDSGEWADTDGDGYGDNYEDYCPYVSGNVSMSFYQGCPDTDGDSFADLDDAFDNDPTQHSDEDGDGYGDNSSGMNPDSCMFDFGSSTKTILYNSSSGMNENATEYGCPDSDSDGYDDFSDPCPFTYGNSWVDFFGCPDADQDGISDTYDPYPNTATDDIEDWDNDSYPDNAPDFNDNTDDFPNDSSQWNDTDMDGYGDNPNGTDADAFPSDNSQWADSDGDGYGDNDFGNNADTCIYSAGNSTFDRYGCADSDGDGVSNPDGDWTVFDGADAFISDSTQWEDSDGDGYGDNYEGTTPDSCVYDAGTSTFNAQYDNSNGQWSNETEYGCPDEDGDGYEDYSDPCPFSYGNSWVDQLGCADADQDGISDLYDPYPNQATNDTTDWDGDTYPDNAFDQSLNTDRYPEDSTQWADTDNDGYGDNPTGFESDAFPLEFSQHEDTDGDGYGDNTNGYEGDACRFSPGNSTMPYFGCEDTDGDSWADDYDAFPLDNTQWFDSDGDGYGDEYNGNFPDACPNQSGDSTLAAGPDNTNETLYGCPDRDNDGYDDQSDPCPTQYGDSWVDELGCADDDGDGISNKADPLTDNATANPEDWDGDGYLDHAADGNNTDQFPNDPTQWVDGDGDGYGDNQDGNNADAFVDEASQWSDIDGDGYGDNQEAWAYEPDGCIYDAGNSTADRLGCIDSDSDSYSDASSTWLAHPFGLADSHPYEPTQWEDADQDGCGDNTDGVNGDEFPTLPTQCSDADGDGYGDNPFGVLADEFPNDANESTDTDGDGYGDNSDAFLLDGTQWEDADEDGYGDNAGGRNPDAFPADSEQWMDSDGDGYGDNSDVENGDQFPKDRYQWNDTDGDGWGDAPYSLTTDAFINDPEQWQDRDGDGYGDNGVVEGGDDLPDNPTQWQDRDGDGFGDDPTGTDPDEFPDDELQWFDADGDGLGDNEVGLNADVCLDPESQEERLCTHDFDNDGYDDDEDEFPQEPTQWSDADGDGRGDNMEGDTPDKCTDKQTGLFRDCTLDYDNDGYFDPLNYELDRDGFITLESLQDYDGDGIVDEDQFPGDASEWVDFDGDHSGDNGDGDDDNDGTPDVEELIAGTDAYSSADFPVEPFSVSIPVLNIGLDSWDLLTLAIGMPSIIYLAFSFVLRDRRTEGFAESIAVAESEEELHNISLGYERALQMRLIATHQGFRLERMRSKRENMLEYDMVEEHNAAVDGHSNKQPVELPVAASDEASEEEHDADED
ncbi:MAG: hypothetical protein QNL47_05370 [Euryarchaeota archaeon]